MHGILCSVVDNCQERKGKLLETESEPFRPPEICAQKKLKKLRAKNANFAQSKKWRKYVIFCMNQCAKVFNSVVVI